MNVFVLSYRSVCPSGEDSDLRVFLTKEKAMEAFDECVSEARKEAEENEYRIEESEGFFEAYEKGWYWDNHIRISVEEKEVEV